MEQRRVRLGDIVDDYCPRERRVTNHAVVAMIEDQIRQTRCAACDSEHPYKAAKVPRSRKKQDTAALYEAVLASRDGEPASPEDRSLPPEQDAIPAPVEAVASEGPPVRVEEPQPEGPAAEAAAPAGEPAPAAEAIEEGPVRRPLIRATLPRPEGQQTTRPLPEFTMRQSGVRGGRLIDNEGRGNARGGRPGGNGSRSSQQGRHGHRPGHGHGHGHGRPHAPQHAGSRYDRPIGHGGRGQRHGPSTRGGKKRSR